MVLAVIIQSIPIKTIPVIAVVKEINAGMNMD